MSNRRHLASVRGGDMPGVAPQPNMDNGGRWHHIASEAECKRAMADKDAEVIESPLLSMTWVVSYKHLTVLRCGSLGGDVRVVEGGWRYGSDLALRFDVQEMRHLADAIKVVR